MTGPTRTDRAYVLGLLDDGGPPPRPEIVDRLAAALADARLEGRVSGARDALTWLQEQLDRQVTGWRLLARALTGEEPT